MHGSQVEPAVELTPRSKRAVSKTRRVEPSEPAAPAAMGSIQIVTMPSWADIYLDGQRVGRSPREIRAPAGRHDIELRPLGQEPGIVRSVTVAADQSTRIVERLAP